MKRVNIKFNVLKINDIIVILHFSLYVSKNIKGLIYFLHKGPSIPIYGGATCK